MEKVLNILKVYIAPFIVIMIAVFGTMWTVFEASGITGSRDLMLALGAVSAFICLLYTLTVKLFEMRRRIVVLESDLEAQSSYCCVVDQKTPNCPLGVRRIVPHSEETIRQGLQNAKRKLRWFGLSAFNVVHNNYDIFEERRDTKYEFQILSEDNTALHDAVDKYFGDTRGKLNAAELIENSKELISRLENELNANVEIVWHNQMPTFRVISVDDHTTYVSFYQRGTDALKSFQLELQTDDATFPIKDWFDAYLEKTRIGEAVNAKVSQSAGD